MQQKLESLQSELHLEKAQVHVCMVFCMNFQIEFTYTGTVYLIQMLMSSYIPKGYLNECLFHASIFVYESACVTYMCTFHSGDWSIIAEDFAEEPIVLINNKLLHFRHLRELNKESLQSKHFSS